MGFLDEHFGKLLCTCVTVQIINVKTRKSFVFILVYDDCKFKFKLYWAIAVLVIM